LLLGEEFECPLPLRERLGLATIENVSSGRGLLRLKNQGSSLPQVNVAYGRGLLRLEKKIRYQKPKRVFLQIITTHLDVSPFCRQWKRLTLGIIDIVSPHKQKGVHYFSGG
jgi:hypothetical protein